MHNLDDMIEKYRLELIKFSESGPVHNTFDEAAVSVAAQPKATEKEKYETGIKDDSQIKPQEPYASYDEFLRLNTAEGLLRVQVFAAEKSYPVPNALVIVSVPLKTEKKEIFRGFTNIDGIIDNISLPAPDSSYSFEEFGTVVPYSIYDVFVSHPAYSASEYINIPVFDSVRSLQPVNLVPQSEILDEPIKNIYTNYPMQLFGGEK